MRIASKERLADLGIVNVVATAELGQFVDLESLASVEGFLYDRANYHCAYLKDENTRAKVSIFATGKIISVGAKSFEAAKHDLNYAARKLTELGLVSRTRIKTKLQNIVATSDLGQSVNLESIASKLPHVIYEPEQFPKAINYAEELEGASVLIFANGKVVFAGLKTQAALAAAQCVLLELARIV